MVGLLLVTYDMGDIQTVTYDMVGLLLITYHLLVYDW